MPRIVYDSWKPGAEAREIIDLADDICVEYQRQGYDLTLQRITLR
jgi:hypothetical protein